MTICRPSWCCRIIAAGVERDEELDSAFLPRSIRHGDLSRRGDADRRSFSGEARRLHHAASESATTALLTELNREHAATRPGDERLDARIRSYELAAKMQLAAPEALDISKEPSTC